jgi:hypothetical protein
MKKILGILVLGFILSSCAPTNYTAESPIKEGITNSIKLAKINRARLALLEPGMSKSQVLQTMGTLNAAYVSNPYLVSLFSIKEDHITVIYYFTRNPYDDYDARPTFGRLTPLILLNGKLIGWGEEALRRAQAKYDITIKKDFDIKVE